VTKTHDYLVEEKKAKIIDTIKHKVQIVLFFQKNLFADYIIVKDFRITSLDNIKPKYDFNDLSCGQKTITISGLKSGINHLIYTIYWGAKIVKSDKKPQTIKENITFPPTKNYTPIIITSVIVPLVFIGVGVGLYYYINIYKKNKKKLEKTEIEEMTINN